MASRAERAASFGAIAADYDRLRPGPAPEAVGWLLPERREVAVDLAAGTGLVSRVLAEQVTRVISVEPDERMAAVLRARSGMSGVSCVVRGVGEALPLASASIDAVLVSAAWHWLDPERAVPELARVLRPGGSLGVLRTGVDTESGLAESGPPRELAERYRSLPETGAFGDAARASFTFTRRMSRDDFVAMFTTYSSYLIAGEAERADRLARLRPGADRLFAGKDTIDVPMRTRCWRAIRQPR